MNSFSQNQLDYLFSPRAIRDQARKIFDRTLNGDGLFTFKEEKLSATASFVLEVTRKNYPDLKIPFHSRWGHINAGKSDRFKVLESKIENLDPMERARVMLDLVIPSVLLDAGAGADWKYKEGDKVFQRSEGLGVASFYLFLSGAFSQDGRSSRSDGVGLSAFTEAMLEKFFQVSGANPLIGVTGRVKLIQNLGLAMQNRLIFKDGRPGNIVDYLLEKYGKKIPATEVLRAVLDGFGSIWPGRLSSGNINLGDVWVHSALGQEGSFECLVPFHKLSQWMTYSLIEPMEAAGIEIFGVDDLTGLAEYRNGGLFVDAGVLLPKEITSLDRTWSPGSDFVIEWRALTVHLLDQVASQVQKALGKNSTEFPLARVLEGGTWWAGRILANQKRLNGNPPISIQSDGTVF